MPLDEIDRGLEDLFTSGWGVSNFLQTLHRLGRVLSRAQDIEPGRSLTLHAYARDKRPVRFQGVTIDLEAMGLDARSPWYHRSEVTGVDRRVQERVAEQGALIRALNSAVNTIEARDLRTFVFTCR